MTGFALGVLVSLLPLSTRRDPRRANGSS
jgi:hypothetical protein